MVRHLCLSVLSVLVLHFQHADLMAENVKNRVDRSVSGTGRSVIVLDASGSMWGKIGSQAKIEIAKKVIGEVVQGWDPAVQLGLTVYGHRDKGDCTDIENLVPPGPINKAEFVKTVNSIQPKGKTPLSDAVTKAAEELKYTEERATVILVSDGIETCGKDPCAISKQLEAQGIEFTAHVIGFDVSKEEEQAQLRCMAENTGGRFLNAKDAKSLKESLEQAVTEIAVVETGVQLVAVHEAGGALLDEVAWQVYLEPEQASEKRKVIEYGKGSQPTYRLAPGRYTAEVRSLKGKAFAQREITVSEGKIAREEVVMPEEGLVQLVAVNSRGGEPLDEVLWNVFQAEEDPTKKPKLVSYGGGSQPKYLLLPGKYTAQVKSQRGEAVAEHQFEVRAGAKTREEVVMAQEGIIALRAVHEPGGEPVEEVRWDVYDIPSDPLKNPKIVKYGRGFTPEYRMLPGKYTAKVTSLKGVVTAEKEIEVKPGVKISDEVVIEREGLVQLSLVRTPGGEPLDELRWELYTIENDPLRKPKLVKYGGGATPTYQVLPGRYLAKAILKNSKQPVSKEVEVLPGKRSLEELVLDAPE